MLAKKRVLGLIAFTMLIVLTPRIIASGKLIDTIKYNWSPSARNAIENLIADNANKKGAYAVFDWDNTSVFGDVQETLFYYQIENLAFKADPQQFWYALTHFADADSLGNLLIPDCEFSKGFVNAQNQPVKIYSVLEDCQNDYKYLYERCRRLNPKAKTDIPLEELKNTGEYKDLRAKLWFAYSGLYKTFQAGTAYTWITFVTAQGYTVKEYRKMAKKGLDWGVNRECKKVFFESPATHPGKAGIISNRLIDNYILNTLKIQPEIGNLFGELKKRKIDVYISTASLQNLIEVIAENPKYGYKLPAGHVMGLRLKKSPAGKFLAQYDFTGGYTINGNAGKAYNINRFLVSKYKANPVLIAGDSDGDFGMMTAFSGLMGEVIPNNLKPLQLILIINRLKKGNIGALCKLAVEQLEKGNAINTRIVLQGRDENKGCFIPVEKTILQGASADGGKLLP